MRLVYQGKSDSGADLKVYEGRETRYMCVNGIVQTAYPKNDSAWCRKGGLLAQKNTIELLPYLYPEGANALVFGLGVGYLPSFFKHYSWNTDVVERDFSIAELATMYFGYRGHCHIGEAREYLGEYDKIYDFVILDAAANDNLSHDLFTREVFTCIDARLTRGGILAVTHIGSPADPVNLAIYRTLQEVFPHVAMYESTLDGTLQLVNIVASQESVELAHPHEIENEFKVAIPEPVTFKKRDLPSSLVVTDSANALQELRQDVKHAWKMFSDRLAAQNSDSEGKPATKRKPKTAFYNLLKRKCPPSA